jgi:hypothetical protein
MQAEAKTVAVTRTLGIIAGVTMTLVLSVCILPVSAHCQHEEALNKALCSLLSLQALCWVPLTHAHDAHGPSILSTNPPVGQSQKLQEYSLHTPTNVEHSPGNEMAHAGSCTVPLLSPRSPGVSPHASPKRSCHLRLPRANSRDEEGLHGAPIGSSFHTGIATGAFGNGVVGGGASAAQVGLNSHVQQVLMQPQFAGTSGPAHLSSRQQGIVHSTLGSGGAGLAGAMSTAHDTHRSNSSAGCGPSSGRASFAGLVKRSEFASVNWEMHNLKLNEEGDIRSAEDIVVEVRQATAVPVEFDQTLLSHEPARTIDA